MPAPVQTTDTVIVVPVALDGVNVQPVAVPVFAKSADVSPEILSLKVNVNDEDNPLFAAVDHEAVGGVVSDAGTVTATDTVPPPRVV